MVFAPAKVEWRAAPSYAPGTPLVTGPLGAGQSVAKNQRDAQILINERRQAAHHRAPPPPPPRPAAHVRVAPQAPGLSRPLTASVDVREIGYRVQSEIEAMLLPGTSFIKFDAVSFRVLSETAPQLSVESRMARAVELAASARMAKQVDGSFDYGVPMGRAPARTRLPVADAPFLNPNQHFSYFAGLRSQQPKTKSHVYFIKVDAAWRGGFAHLHVRVRVQPPERAPLGCPCAIPPLTESKLVLEGILGNLAAQSPLDSFPANLSRIAHHPADRRPRP
jgi:hypothetical protein